MITTYIVILGKGLVNPLLAAFLVALILEPMASHFERFKMSRMLSTVVSILLVFIVLSLLFVFFSAQIASITRSFGDLHPQWNDLLERGQETIEQWLGVDTNAQLDFMKKGLGDVLKNSANFMSTTVSATAGLLSAGVLFLLSLFFFLYYRSFLLAFLYKVFKSQNHEALGVALVKIKTVVRKYILGLLLVILIVGLLNTVGLASLGIEHALFFGVLAAALTVIPYIGIALGSLLPIVFALITKDSAWYALGVVGVFGLVQVLEGNVLTPNIIGNQVSINPFAAIIGLFLGGMVLGTLGMIVAIPLLAITKVICESVEAWQPIAFLIGEPPTEPKPPSKPSFWKRLFSSKKTTTSA